MSNLTCKTVLNRLLPVALMCFCGPAFGGFVDLFVDGTGSATKLDISDSDVKCGNDLYCIKTTKGTHLDVDFRLKQACQENGPEYRLTGMQFSMIQWQPRRDGSGGMEKAFGYYVLPAVVTGDFDTDAKGNVLWGGANNNKLSDAMIKLRNENRGEYVVFFQIEATHCTDPTKVIYLDPRVENTGR